MAETVAITTVNFTVAHVLGTGVDFQLAPSMAYDAVAAMFGEGSTATRPAR